MAKIPLIIIKSEYQMTMRMWNNWISLYSYVYVTFWKPCTSKGSFGDENVLCFDCGGGNTTAIFVKINQN